MKRTTIDLNNFYVKYDSSNENADMFICWINRQWGNNPGDYHQFGGMSGYYYGIVDGVVTYNIRIPIGVNVEVYPLDQWAKIFSNDKQEIEVIEDDGLILCYDGEKYHADDCHLIGHSETEYAHRDDLTYCEYGDVYCLNDDAIYVDHMDMYFMDGNAPDSVTYSSYESEYIDKSSEDIYYGYVSSSSRMEYFIDRCDDVVEYNGDYYRNGETAENHGLYYNDNIDEWCDAPDTDKDNADYHSLNRVTKYTSGSKFTIGFEIEKEDDDACEIPYYPIHNELGWCKENDGSLDGNNGYELISPAFDLYDSMMDKDIKDARLIKLINANSSSSCGGHINIGSSFLNTTELFEHLSGYFPLFYAMYEHRIDSSYSKAKKKHKYFDRDKMSSIYIKSNVLEFRVPSAVKNVTNLLWRRDLMRILCDSIKLVPANKTTSAYYKGKSEVEVLKMLLNPASKLYKHLRVVYSQAQLERKADLFVGYSESYNDKIMPRIIKGNRPNDNLDASNEMGA